MTSNVAFLKSPSLITVLRAAPMRTPGPISLSLLQRHHFADKGPSSQSYVFPVVMYGCESWTIKKAECQRIDGFRTVVLEKTPAPETGHQGDQTPLLTPKGNQP